MAIAKIEPLQKFDLGTVVRQMGLVPIDKPLSSPWHWRAALPMVPVILYATPADELVRAVLKMLG